ncbi:RNA polymerase sigma factor [Sphingomonas sp.]|uniref:RNA polymerase sigma factor n=1 Tax=Sphingomonas sp. TaxID=28214 RepID=UPI0028AEC383|nr:RNA polymerase sigma factor [Sphingomonas sp.]
MRPDKKRGVQAERGALLDQLARRYAGPLARFFERRVAMRDDVPDLVQDVFLKLSRMPDPSAIEQPDRFLFVTAANTLRDRARREAARGGIHESWDDEAHPGSDFSPQRVLEGREAVLRLRDALLELPERTRDIFVLRVLEGLKIADIARLVGISTRATEKHVARAMAHVTTALEAWRED